MNDAPRKILVVALDNLGDAVMASSVLSPLKIAFPNAFVGLWAKEYTAGLFEGHPFVDRLHAADPFWDASPGVPSGGLASFYSVVKSIRAERYDAALLLNTEWRRALAARVAGIPVRIGYDRRHSRFFLTKAVTVSRPIQHFSDDHRILIERGLAVAAPAEAYVSSLFISAREKMEFESWRARVGIVAKKYWVAHLFSGDPLKNWPLPLWLELIEKFGERHSDQRCAVLLGPSEEKKLSEEQLASLKMRATVLISPALGLLKAALAAASVVVDGDSGPGHVAAALKTPVVSLFGATNPLRSRPVGGGAARIVSARAVADIRVDDVIAAMENFPLVYNPPS